jgi:hypothetical protein
VPDYALTLGAIAKELQDVGARLSAIEDSPQLQETPASVAQQVRQEAGRLAESQVAQALAAQEGFERGQRTLDRVAFVEQRAQRDRRIVWGVGGGAPLVGAVLGTLLFLEINRHVPDDWRSSAGWATPMLASCINARPRWRRPARSSAALWACSRRHSGRTGSPWDGDNRPHVGESVSGHLDLAR